MEARGAWTQREAQQFDGYEWDESKRRTNISKHGVDFVDGVAVLLDTHIVSDSVRGTEERYVAVAMREGEALAVIYTVRGNTCRIISVRKARRNERQKYQAILG